MNTISPQAAITFVLGISIGMIIYFIFKSMLVIIAAILVIGLLDNYFNTKSKPHEERL